MKYFFYLLVLPAMILFGCKDIDEPEPQPQDFKIEGLTFENYPKVDCSTSAHPLQTVVACELLDWSWSWQGGFHGYFVRPDTLPLVHSPFREAYYDKIQKSGTHGAYLNLIKGGADLILVARKPSEDELNFADSLRVKFNLTPVALDAFIFVGDADNPVHSLTTKNIQDIYTGKLTNWNELGGKDAEIVPYRRNRNSGSQELMESLVMKNLEMLNNLENPEIFTMSGIFEVLLNDPNGISYTVYYYKEYIQKGKEQYIKKFAVNGIYPDSNSIKERTYPYTTEVYAVIRRDLDGNSNAYKIFELLQSAAGKEVIGLSGYVPN